MIVEELLLSNFVIVFLITLFWTMNGNYYVFQILNPFKSGPLLLFSEAPLESKMNILSTFELLSVQGFSFEDVLIFSILWITVSGISIFSFRKRSSWIVFLVLLTTMGELYLIFASVIPLLKLLVEFVFPSLSLASSIFVLKAYTYKLEVFYLSFRRKIKSTHLSFAVLAIIGFFLMIPNLIAKDSPINMDYAVKIFFLMTWSGILIGSFGSLGWLKLKAKLALGSVFNFDLTDILAIFMMGSMLASIFALALLEFRILNIQTLTFFIAFTILYLHIEFGIEKLVKELVETFTENFFLSTTLFIFIIVILFPYYTQSWISLPWFDIWHWWGNAYYVTTTGTIYDRYSFFFPGTTGMLSSGILAAVFTIVPEKTTALLFIRVFPLLIVFVQALLVYYLTRLLIGRTRRGSQLFSILSVVAFLSSSWTLLYATAYTRESIGLLLVGLLFLIAMTGKNSNDPKNCFLLSLTLSGIATMTIYFSEIEWIFIYPSTMLAFLLPSFKNKKLKVKKDFVLGSMFGSLVATPAILTKVISMQAFKEGSVLEWIPNFNQSSLTVSPFSRIYQNMFDSLIPSINLANLSSVTSTLGYSIMNTLGLTGFIVALIGLFYLPTYCKASRFRLIILLYTLELISFPLILLALPKASILLDLRRRYLPQLSFSLAIMFGIGTSYLSCWFYSKTRKKSAPTISIVAGALIITVVAAQLTYPIQVSSYLDVSSQSEVASILMQLDKKLPENVTIIADKALLDQAEGLLAPRYVVRGEYFASLFQGIPQNRTQLSILKEYLNRGDVIILTILDPDSSMQEITLAVPVLDVSMIPLGEVKILYDNSYKTMIAIVSNSSIEEVLIDCAKG